MGSPPPAGSKNVVLRFRSVRSMVMPPARTGTAAIRRIEVMRMDQGNIGTRSRMRELVRMLITVTTKLIEAAMEDTPARWREKMAMSTAGPLWNRLSARGG